MTSTGDESGTMTVDETAGKASAAAAASGADDAFLMRAIAGGDAAALRKLIDRYDRLVRFAIFRASRERCRRDPHWVDSIASDTWIGLTRTLQRNPESIPDSAKTYLLQVARNRSISALRSTRPATETLDDETGRDVADEGQGPDEAMTQLEELGALRACVENLNDGDFEIYGHLETITQRRWREVASATGIAESTLRSRWKKIVSFLGDCVEGKIGRKSSRR